MAALGLRICDPDGYLCELLTDFPQEVAATVVRLAAEKSRPVMTASDLLIILAKAGVPVFAGRLGRQFGEERPVADV